MPNSGTDATIGDFNKDGILDIASSTSIDKYPFDPARNFVFLGLGDGVFGPPTMLDPGGECWSAGQLKTADVNNDGKLDLILAEGGTNNLCFGNKMSVQLGDGLGGFGSGIITPTGGSLLSFAVGDFNEDGKLDLAVRSADDHAILILLGNGDGTFTAGATLGPQWSENIVVKDLNGDGHLDLAATYADGVRVFFGDGTGNFSSPVFYPINNPSFFGIEVGDFNEDGIPDLAASNGSQGAVFVLLGTGDGQFSTPVAFPAGTNPFSEVIVADFDRDGHQDIAVGNCSAGAVTVLKGDGHGGFAAPATFPSGPGSGCRLASADLNSDGLPDLVTTSDAGMSVLLNSFNSRPQQPHTSKQTPYILTVSTSGSGTVTSTDGDINCPGVCGYSYSVKTPVTLNAVPATGWSFAGWSGACSGTGSCHVTMTKDLSVRAMFTQNQGFYSLTVSVSGAGIVTSTDKDKLINCPGTCSHTYQANAQVTLKATATQRGIFSGWSGACSGTGPCNVTMSHNLAVTATFSAPQPEMVIHSFGTGNDGQSPQVNLTFDSAGNLYGVTPTGGAYNKGVVFELAPDGTDTVLYSFCTENGCRDGAYPQAGLVHATDGNFYGTTLAGGVNSAGTVFKITPRGALTTVYSFCALNNCSDGSQPTAGLVQGADGNFYGTTFAGGAKGYGTAFKVTLAGTLTTLHSFCAQNNCTDGVHPQAGLVQGADGNFYGTTEAGGGGVNLSRCNGNGCGTAFKITPAGALATLYSFCAQENCPDGASPFAGLILDSSGNLYGTTVNGGKYGVGTAFELSPNGTETVLHNFGNGADGQNPSSGLIFDGSGNLYGTTAKGGLYFGGTVFELVPYNARCCREILVYNYGFIKSNDGRNLSSGLIFDPSGNLYGTTGSGGVYDRGAVFRIRRGGIGGANPLPQLCFGPDVGSWSYTLLHDFSGGADRAYPQCSFASTQTGNLYDTTSQGDSHGLGVGWEIIP